MDHLYEFARHLRTVNFALVLVCAGLALAVGLAQQSPLRRAYEDVLHIIELRDHILNQTGSIQISGWLETYIDNEFRDHPHIIDGIHQRSVFLSHRQDSNIGQIVNIDIDPIISIVDYIDHTNSGFLYSGREQRELNTISDFRSLWNAMLQVGSFPIPTEAEPVIVVTADGSVIGRRDPSDQNIDISLFELAGVGDNRQIGVASLGLGPNFDVQTERAESIFNFIENRYPFLISASDIHVLDILEQFGPIGEHLQQYPSRRIWTGFIPIESAVDYLSDARTDGHDFFQAYVLEDDFDNRVYVETEDSLNRLTEELQTFFLVRVRAVGANATPHREISTAAGASWEAGTFETVFHELLEELGRIEALSLSNGEAVDASNLNLYRLREILRGRLDDERRNKIEEDDIEVIGFRLPAEEILTYGIIIVLAVQIYFLSHLTNFSIQLRPNSDAWRFAWIGVYGDVLSKFAVFLSSCVLPVSTSYILANVGFSTGLRLERFISLWGLIFSFIVACFTLGVLSRVWRRRRAMEIYSVE